jgi:O-antigen ligase
MNYTEAALAPRRGFDRARLAAAADWLAIAVAVSLPWSTSAAGILIALWLVAVIPVVDYREVWRSARHPAVALPLLLCGLAIVGLLWTVAPAREAFGGLTSFAKLLVIPLLIQQFSHSDKGIKVVAAFLVSCTALLLVSWTFTLIPSLPTIQWGHRGVPVKDVIVQSGEFMLCLFALAHLVLDAWQTHRRQRALALLVLALVFLANLVFVATSRTSVMVFFPFVLIFALQRFGWRGIMAGALVACVLAASAAALSPYLRYRVYNLVSEVNDYEAGGAFAASSAGIRLEFWKKSIRIIGQAPVIGHGTGSIDEMFRRDAVGRSGISTVVTSNPHNQTFNVAIQLGLLGVVVLYAMWIAHAWLFCRAGFAAWIGLDVVVQNVVSSLTNSQLFYYVPGWIYVFGVGVLGGMILHDSQRSGLSSSIGAAK